MSLPEFLEFGEEARLFPVLSTSSKEGRTTSIFLSCLSQVRELGSDLLASVGQKIGSRSIITAYTEVVLKNRPEDSKDRPDGLITVKNGSKEWRALIETKVGNAEIDYNQIEKYRKLAKDNEIDCIITISNQFATSPFEHPVDEIQKSRSKIPVYHWSWMLILTSSDLLINNDYVKDENQDYLLREFRRFLSHESAGVRGFDRMPKEWAELSKLISSGGKVFHKSTAAERVAKGWRQECKDLSLILSRMTDTAVSEKIRRKLKGDAAARFADDLERLCTENILKVEFEVPNAASTLVVKADAKRKHIEAGMTLRAPEDKVSAKARVNWLLRQIRSEADPELVIRLFWPGKSEATQHDYDKLKESPEIAGKDKDKLSPHSFEIFRSRYLGAKFGQPANFISALEEFVPKFYGEIGEKLVSWTPPAAKIKVGKSNPDDVSVEAISEVD